MIGHRSHAVNTPRTLTLNTSYRVATFQLHPFHLILSFIAKHVNFAAVRRPGGTNIIKLESMSSILEYF